MIVGLAKLAAEQRSIPVGVLSLMLPDGREMLAPHLRVLDTFSDGSWPSRPLLVCAVRRRDYKRTVFGPSDSSVDLSDALTASCAVPGYFGAVKIEGEAFVDGGVVSATNADVVARHDLDLVIVISPMTGHARWPSASRLMRNISRRALDRELSALQRHDMPTVVVEPSRSVTQHMSMDFMSERASVEIVRSAFLDTGEQIMKSARLRGLRTRNGRATASASGGPSGR